MIVSIHEIYCVGILKMNRYQGKCCAHAPILFLFFFSRFFFFLKKRHSDFANEIKIINAELREREYDIYSQ